MIVLKHECGEVFLAKDGSDLPKVCSKARKCIRPCSANFENIGIVTRRPIERKTISPEKRSLRGEV